MKGVNIPLGARIIAVADYYDSVINPCATQWQKSHQEALQELLSAMGTAFDPEIVKAFIEAIVPGNTIKPVPVSNKNGYKEKSKTAAAALSSVATKVAETSEVKDYEYLWPAVFYLTFLLFLSTSILYLLPDGELSGKRHKAFWKTWGRSPWSCNCPAPDPLFPVPFHLLSPVLLL